MKLVLLSGLVIASALAAPPHPNNFGTSVKYGRRGRQVENFNGQAVRNGAKVRKVLRRGRQFLNPGLAVPAPFAPVQTFRNAPLIQSFPAQAPFRFANAPAPLRFAPAPLPTQVRLAPTPVRFAPAPLPAPIQFAAAPAPLPITNLRAVAPLPIAPVRSVAPTLEYGAPATVAPEVRAPSDAYLPAEEEEEENVFELRSAGDSYAAADEVVELRDNYGAAVEEVVEVVELRDNYGAAAEEVVELRDNYGAAAEEVVEVRDGYLAAQPTAPVVVAVRAQPTYSVPRTVANVKSNIVLAKPIAIVRSHHNPPAETSNFDYSFESENGIKQEATGTMRLVDDNEVSVMKGSYSYIGADGLDYLVEWYADETGFHATAPHLPKSVVPNHPEVAAAVRAQIAFAAEEDRAAAASGRSTSYSAPEDDLGQYTPLASYN